MAAAMAKVPASILSGSTVQAPPARAATPSTAMVAVPAPLTLPPIALTNSASAATSGSRAALRITVVPSASAAAINSVSVAPTLGKLSEIVAPLRPAGQVACRRPPSMRICAPMASRPCRCRSTGRAPMSQPPGSAITASRSRLSSGPMARKPARSDLTASSHGCTLVSAAAWISIAFPDTVTAAPTERSTSIMERTSIKAGTSRSTTGSRHSRAAAISASAPFLEPLMVISPRNTFPPVTCRQSWYCGSGSAPCAASLCCWLRKPWRCVLLA
mmetsp:Transcript_5008/g.12969  ORF Transcript_5008/g.12969 Transcript_5008/m.12969 type:complete len:273 (+) Transcript_5008:594-1412(+)